MRSLWPRYRPQEILDRRKICEAMGRGQTGLNAFIGAVITIGLSFTGFSPLLGGGVAGYLQAQSPRTGAKVGAISGVIATLPVLFILALGVMFLPFFGFGPGVPMGGFGFGILALVMVPMLVVWFVILSACGGYVGAYLHSERH